MGERHLARIDSLIKKVGSAVDAFVVTDLTSIRYLAGFTGSSGILLLTPGERIFVTDFRYDEQAHEEVGQAAKVVVSSTALATVARTLASRMRIGRLGFESSMSFRSYDLIKGGGAKLVPFDDAVLGIRAVKDDAELLSIRKAVKRAESALLAMKPWIRAGITERSIADRLAAKLRRMGCRTLPFDIIVASGPNSSRPHATATGRKLDKGDLVTIDWGGEADGYFSDMTRTFLVKGGRGVGRKKEIYDVVLKAQRRAIKAVRPGVGLRALDAVARDYITQKGYGEHFGHGLGHGIGLDVHELPRVSKHSHGKLRASEVFTVEPGVYVAGLGGVRIEDMVVAGKKGCEVLTSLPSALELI